MTDAWRRTHEWGTLTRAEIGAARDAGALPVLTVGAVEQHADHLPVDTDSLSAYQIALRAAARSEEHTSELQSHRDLHSFPTRRSSDLGIAGADRRRG